VNFIEHVTAQRNAATDALAQALAQRDKAAETLHASFAALDQCILSGQVPDDAVPQLVASVPGFAEWRAQRPAGA